MPVLIAFLHHVAAFGLVAVLVLEFALMRQDLTTRNARVILFADAGLGLSAVTVLIAGVLRVLYFEKGANYYLHSAPFIAKVSLFVIAVLLSIYPTVEFVSWRKVVKEGRVPLVDSRKLRTIRRLIHYELAAVLLLILCAAMMAKGVGQLA
jgi:putative membrane protein